MRAPALRYRLAHCPRGMIFCMGTPSRIQASHISAELHRRFDGLIDMSDVSAANSYQRESHFLTRAQAAFSLVMNAQVADEIAASSVTDGTGDNGIDAVWVDKANSVIWLVQSKWHEGGTKTLGKGDALAVIKGLRDLTETTRDRFNSKFESHWPAIEAALADPDFRVRVLITHTGPSDLADEVEQPFSDVAEEWNEVGETLLVVSVVGLPEMHQFVRKGAVAQIDIEMVLENWGVVSEPFRAYYGVASAADVASWFNDWGNTLFDRNLRSALGVTAVNAGLLQTLSDEPGLFWYFNNGVTVLAQSVSKTGVGGSSRVSGQFVLTDASVVNGAQTVSSIYNASVSDAQSVADAKVWIRVIELEGAAEDFGSRVTRATNTQNSVENRDFMALDAEQERIASELRLSHNVVYAVRRGESVPDNAVGCSASEALIAVACLNTDSTLAVLAKSAIGRLEDTSGRYYPRLFNTGTPAGRVWTAVQVQRIIDHELADLRRQNTGKPAAIALQGNRLIAHLVFQSMGGQVYIDNIDPDNVGTIETKIRDLTRRAHARVQEVIEEDFASNYVTSLFKNSDRCGKIVRSCGLVEPA